jgi:ribonucleotide reductase beta subunit family protein with ferritin-like domain
MEGESMERDFKGIWIPREVWLNKDLKAMEKLFLLK